MSAIIETALERQDTVNAAFDRRVDAVMASFELHHFHIQNYLFGLTRNWHDAEDLAQSVWKWCVVGNFAEDQIGSLPLLRQKAYCLFIDFYRAKKRRPEIVMDELPEAAVEETGLRSFSDESEKAMKVKFWEEFREAKLTEAQQDVVWLAARYGHTYAEIEKITGTPASTVGDWVCLARKRIAAVLENNR